MAAAWARRRGGRPRLEAATVDHGLRAESADEARAVAELCERLGVPHRILDWRGAKPKSRIQERAREARYALLGECADAIGADVVVTAHHLDDQAETALLRLAARLRDRRLARHGGARVASERDDRAAAARLRQARFGRLLRGRGRRLRARSLE